MRLKFICSVVILVVGAILTGCNATDKSTASYDPNAPCTPSAPDPNYADGARRITIAELENMMKDGKAVVVDVRNQSAFDVAHIPGARLIPASEILNHINELPRDKTIVTYCS